MHKVGSSVTVLDAEELQERNIRFVSDALKAIPSLQISTTGGRGGMTQVRLRGSEANHTLVLLDGMRVSDASTGEFDLARMTLEGIERIEVLLGPQSTLYGSDAAAGVILITTKKGEGPLSGNVSASVGSHDLNEQSFQIGGGHQGWDYAVSGTHIDTDGISSASAQRGNTEEDAYNLKNIKLRAGYDHQLFSSWIVYSRDSSLVEFDDWAAGMAVDSLINVTSRATEALSWVLELPLLDNRFQNQLQVSHAQNDSDTLSFWGPSFTYTDRETVDYKGSFELNENHTIQFGAEHISESLVTGGVNREIDINGTFLQWLASVGQLDLSLGMRRDDHEQFGDHDTHRVTASYNVNDNWRLRGVYGTGFKAPTLVELYDATWAGNNINLKPEETESVELGIEFQRDALRTGINWFEQDVENQIQWLCAGWVCQNQNAMQADSRGVELSAGFAWKALQIDGSITWMDSSQTSAAGVVSDKLRVADRSGNLQASYNYDDGRIWGQVLYKDDRLDTGNNIVAGYTVLNIGGSYDLSDEITLLASIDNLLDESYEEVYSYGTAGRSGRVTFRWDF